MICAVELALPIAWIGGAATVAAHHHREVSMSIFTHATVGTNDLDRARRFYDGVLGELGYSRSHDLPHATVWGKGGSMEFFATKPRDGNAATVGNGVTLGFSAPSAAAIAAFHAKGLELGGKCEGPPGPRDYAPGMHAAYLRDADGNKICAYGPDH
jgi:catechol 2,3-dioxygenase-like lactoylglutathione lyase family enzyme